MADQMLGNQEKILANQTKLEEVVGNQDRVLANEQKNLPKK